MKQFFETLQNIWKIADLRQRILITLAFIFIYRIGSYVVLPGVDPAALDAFRSSGEGNLLGLLDMFAGGSFFRASVFALGIMPYISASIAIQLLGLAVPYFQKLQKEGESGRKKITRITRYLTVVVTAFQAIGYITFLRSIVPPEAILVNPILFAISTVVVLTAGTIFCMWLGEKITDRGIGNGISLLITVGIIAMLPGATVQEFTSRFNDTGGLIYLILELVVLVVVTFLVVMLVQGVRRVPVQYAKRIIGNRQYGGARQFIPLRVNASGVMPIIFAQAIMFVPSFFAQFFPESPFWQGVNSAGFYNSWGYNLAFFFMVVIFTYFYTAITVNPQQMSEDMKRNGGFIPGVKPGKKTTDFLDTVLSRITLPGSIFLALVAILPFFGRLMGVNQSFAEFYGGTSLLIMVGVVLDTLQQIESHLLMRHYDGLMKSGRVKGRAAAGVSSGY